MRFGDLEIGQKFEFSSSRDSRFMYSGLEQGPWIKLSARKYAKLWEPVSDANCYKVGRISVGTLTWPVKG